VLPVGGKEAGTRLGRRAINEVRQGGSDGSERAGHFSQSVRRRLRAVSRDLQAVWRLPQARRRSQQTVGRYSQPVRRSPQTVRRFQQTVE